VTPTNVGCGIAYCDACTIHVNGEKECRSTIPAAFIRRLGPIKDECELLGDAFGSL
jgi:hypothetical protein